MKPPERKPFPRRLRRLADDVATLPAQLIGAPVGHGASRRSPNFQGGRFRNPVPTALLHNAAVWAAVRSRLGPGRLRQPPRPVPVIKPRLPQVPRDRGLHVTWLGHASALIDIDGVRILVDPVLGERCSPFAFAGPRRLHPVPVAVNDLPPVDAVVISHDHYDHLDEATIISLSKVQATMFVVPLGVGSHLTRWGIAAGRIRELDWGEEHRVQSASGASVRLTATAARHFSGRGPVRYRTLWASWVVESATHRLFFTGDSGYWDGFAKIGARYGPFDVSLMQIGAYDPAWPDVHMTPEEGVAAHLDLRAAVLLPVHWGTFDLAPHRWSEPVERLHAAATQHGARLVVPKPGEPVDIDDVPPGADTWWTALGTAGGPSS